MRWVGHVARLGKKKKKNVYRLFVRKTEYKRQQGGLRRMWVDNIKKDHVKVERGGVDRNGLVQDRYR
jgi:hypothetical protein